MRTLLRWLVVTLGIAALVRWLRRRSETPAPATADPLEDPAEELRRKLAASRTLHSASSEASPSVDERRSEVHAQGRAALADMTGSDEG